MRWACAVLALAVTGPAQAAPYAVRLEARRCTPAASRAATLGPAWQALAAFIRDCPVRGPDGKLALVAVTLRIDLIDADPALRKLANLEIPDPLLLRPDGTWLGTLPEGFPTDPPGALRVTFRDWHGGLPRRIDLYEGGVSALSPHAIDPMRWDEGARGYRWDLVIP